MLGRFYHYDGQLYKAIEYYNHARELAEPADRAETLTNIYSFLAGAYQHLARFPESMEWARTCIALGERHNYPQACAQGYEFLAEDNTLIGHWAEAQRCAELDRQIGEQIGAQDRIVWSQFPQAWSLTGLGELVQARDTCQAAMMLAEQIGENRLLIWLGAWFGKILDYLGDTEAAWASAELALKRADELGQAALQSLCRSIVGSILLREGKAEQALSLCLEGADLYRQTDLRNARLYLEDTLALAYLANGDVQAAEGVITGLLELCREVGSESVEGIALRIQGQIQAAQGNWVEAEAAFRAAIDRHRGLGSRLELARAYFHQGKMQKLRGQDEAAQGLPQTGNGALRSLSGCPRDKRLPRAARLKPSGLNRENLQSRNSENEDQVARKRHLILVLCHVTNS